MYQLAVIGAGPGGYEAAIRAAQLGLRVALIEKDALGGTCLNRGCIPTKALLHTAEVYRAAKEGAALGVCAREVTLDERTMFARKEEVVRGLRAGIAQLVRANRIDLYEGEGRIEAAGRVAVGGSTVEAERILVATGSVPALPPVEGIDLCITSDDLLDGGSLPQRLAIIGGGVIGVEFATFYGELGCQVTVLEGLDRLLPTLDRELGQNLAMLFKKRGVAVHTGARVLRVERDGDALRVFYEGKEGAQSVSGEAVLCAIGRRPNTEGLFAEGLEPAMDGRSIAVDGDYETSIPGVYAIGDVSGKIQLAHMAAAQGADFAARITGGAGRTDLTAVPSCIYCRPEIACVGLTADEARAAGRPVAVGKATLAANGRTVIQDGGRAFIKVTADPESHVVLGAQLMCEHATDMVSEFTAAVVNGLTVEQMLRVMRPHPTFEEGVQDALEAVLAKLPREPH